MYYLNIDFIGNIGLPEFYYGVGRFYTQRILILRINSGFPNK